MIVQKIQNAYLQYYNARKNVKGQKTAGCHVWEEREISQLFISYFVLMIIAVLITYEEMIY